ncbi:DUF2769 domain-containing protein [bacterium]|nr:DUF2769 domain-containing protein [bacterium]
MAQVDDTKENLQKCICGQCPSFNQCMKDQGEGLYCAKGKSSCEFDKEGCICGTCPLTPEYDLDGVYYCSIGKAE